MSKPHLYFKTVGDMTAIEINERERKARTLDKNGNKRVDIWLLQGVDYDSATQIYIPSEEIDNWIESLQKAKLFVEGL